MSKYEFVKKWRERNPEYNKLWMRRNRKSKKAVSKIPLARKYPDDLSDLNPVK